MGDYTGLAFYVAREGVMQGPVDNNSIIGTCRIGV
jgi:hypothetical protein